MSFRITPIGPNLAAPPLGRGGDNRVAGVLSAIVAEAVRQASEIYDLGPEPAARWNAMSSNGLPDGKTPRTGDIVRSLTNELGAAINIAPMGERDLYDALDQFAQKVAVLVNATPYRLDDVFAALTKAVVTTGITPVTPDAVIATLQDLVSKLPDRL